MPFCSVTPQRRKSGAPANFVYTLWLFYSASASWINEKEAQAFHALAHFRGCATAL
jgi:hypothetical protein